MMGKVEERIRSIKTKAKKVALLATAFSVFNCCAPVKFTSQNKNKLQEEKIQPTFNETEKYDKLKEVLLNDPLLYSGFIEQRNINAVNNFCNISADYQEKISASLNNPDKLKKSIGELALNAAFDVNFRCCTCATGVIEKLGPEYKEIVDGMINPHYTEYIINYLGGNKENKVNNIDEIVEKSNQERPNHILAVFHKSEGNTSTGLHMVVVAGGNVYSFNPEKTVKAKDYFTGNYTKGYVFDLTENANKNKIVQTEYSQLVDNIVENVKQNSNFVIAKDDGCQQLVNALLKYASKNITDINNAGGAELASYLRETGRTTMPLQDNETSTELAQNVISTAKRITQQNGLEVRFDNRKPGDLQYAQLVSSKKMGSNTNS